MRLCKIMSGPSGSGKSTYIEKAEWFKDSVTYSADHYFGLGAAYKFDPAKLPQAHSLCLRLFIAECEHSFYKVPDGIVPILVVDNTNTTSEEIAPYYSVAKAFGYSVELITLNVPPHIAASRNIHGVPEVACKAMYDRIQARKIPRFWDIKLTQAYNRESESESESE